MRFVILCVVCYVVVGLGCWVDGLGGIWGGVCLGYVLNDIL